MEYFYNLFWDRKLKMGEVNKYGKKDNWVKCPKTLIYFHTPNTSFFPFHYTIPAPPHLHHHHRSDPPPPSLKLRSSSSPRLIGLPHFLFLPKTSKSRWFLVLLTASRHLLRFHLPSIIFFVFPASSTFNGGGEVKLQPFLYIEFVPRSLSISLTVTHPQTFARRHTISELSSPLR